MRSARCGPCGAGDGVTALSSTATGRALACAHTSEGETMQQRDPWTTPEVSPVSQLRTAEAPGLQADLVSSVLDLG